jgi:hypothetical protein
VRSTFGIVLVCGLVATLPTEAAYVLPNGKVLISQGEGFHPIDVKTEVNAGDSVVATPGSFAKIVYSDGCVITVSPGNVVTVEERNPAVSQSECSDPSGNSDSVFNVDATLLASPEVGVVLAKDAESSGPWPAGP